MWGVACGKCVCGWDVLHVVPPAGPCAVGKCSDVVAWRGAGGDPAHMVDTLTRQSFEELLVKPIRIPLLGPVMLSP